MRHAIHHAFDRSLLLVALVLSLLASACMVGEDPAGAEDSSGFRAREVDTVSVDPCRSYPDRVRLMELVQERHPYPFAGTSEAWPDGREGFITQTAWQLDSGRATRSSSGDTLWGWWPNVNYALTAWQLIVLQRRGELANVQSIEYLDGARFDPSPEFEAAIDAYYAELDATREAAEAGRIPASQVGDRQATLQKLLWKVHSTALDAALARNTDQLARLPWAERRFARAWGYSLVDILTQINFPTDSRFVDPINGLVLPERTVRTSDYNPFSNDLPAGQRTGVIGLVLLDEFEGRSGGAIATAARNFASTRERSEEAAERFIALLRDQDFWGFVRTLGG